MNRFGFNFGVTTLLLLAACTDRPSPVGVKAPAEEPDFAAIGPQGDYVATPDGRYHRTCVHEIPTGAVVGRNGVVTRLDGTTFQIPKCRYPSYPSIPRPSRRAGNALAPIDTGWVEWAFDEEPPGSSYQQLEARWTVPAAPTGTYSGVQTYFSFPGLVSDSFILQPVIQYGSNGEFGGSYWTAASWHCDGADNQGSCTHSVPITVAPGHTMYGLVVANNCSGGVWRWAVLTEDRTSGNSTGRFWIDTENYYWTTGGAVEVRTYPPEQGFTSCDQFPQSGVFYYGDTLFDNNLQLVTPAWNKRIQPGLDPECSFDVTFTTSSVNLYHNPPPPPPPPPSLTVSISGPTLVQPDVYCYYSSSVSGGVPPYNYSWTPGGSTDDWADVYTGDSDFDVDLHVTDSQGSSGSTFKSVTVSSSARVSPNMPISGAAPR